MKIIYSLWTKPFYMKNTEKFKGGFSSMKFFYYSWVVSFFSVFDKYDNIVFNTDSHGAELLKPLNLPFAKISTDFDNLRVDTRFWSVGKIMSYITAGEPFMHMDYDSFLWDSLDKLGEPRVFYQMKEPDEPHYIENLKMFNEEVPNHMEWLHYAQTHYKKDFIPNNMGMFGGYDHQLIARCAGMIYELMRTDKVSWDVWNKMIHWNNDTFLNCFLEQLFMSAYMEFAGVKSVNLMDEGIKFTHIWGSTKKHEVVEQKLTTRMEKDYPDYIETIDYILSQN